MVTQLPTAKPVLWVGSSKDDLLVQPASARLNLGNQLRAVQKGEVPTDYESMSDIGKGVFQLRTSVQEGWFRMIYIAKFPEGIYVLHCFQKKSNKTSVQDIEIARKRYKAVISERNIK